MTPENLLPPARIVALGGPVSRALAAMRSDPHAVEVERVRDLRRRIAARIAADLDLMDALTLDADLEPSLAAPEPIITTGWGYGDRCRHSDQEHWADGGDDDHEYDAGDDREEENEHGGDIQDEPHDEEPDREPSEDGEPSLGSLAGTAGGVEGSQIDWAGGGTSDLEVSAPSAVHRRELMHREPGPALTEARERADRLSGRRRRGGELRILGPDSNFYAVAAIGRR